MKIKAFVRDHIPGRMYEKLRRLKSLLLLFVLFMKQDRRFSKNAALPGNMGQKQLETQLIFFSHQIEKGLSHSNFRPGFGSRPIYALVVCLKKWNSHGYSKDIFGFKVATSALKAYIDKHDEIGCVLPDFFNSAFDREIMKDIDASDPSFSGTSVISGSENSSSMKTYSQILNSRVSIREFEDCPVSESTIESAISLAMRAPTVCNRQPQAVRVIFNKLIIKQALTIQGGWRGYEFPPALLLVTAHNSSFNNAIERNEPYVDGGIFSMALLGALESYDLGACPLNTMFDIHQDGSTRRLLNIPEEEEFIMYIAVGKKKVGVSHPRSFRKAAETVTTVIR